MAALSKKDANLIAVCTSREHKSVFAFFLHKSFLSRLHPVLYSCTEKAAPVRKGYNRRAFSREVGMCVS